MSIAEFQEQAIHFMQLEIKTLIIISTRINYQEFIEKTGLKIILYNRFFSRNQ